MKVTYNKKWWFRTIVIYLMFPTISSLIVYYSNNTPVKSKEIRHSTEGPFKYFDTSNKSSPKININGIKTQHLYGHKAHLWNSGLNSVAKFRVKYQFINTTTAFKIFCVIHNTEPAYQFGYIKELNSDQSSKTFEYEFINKKDNIVVNFLTNESCKLKIYAKEFDVDVVEMPAILKSDEFNHVWAHTIYISIISMLLLSIFFLLRNKSDIEFVMNKEVVVQDEFEKIDQKALLEIKKICDSFAERIKQKD